MSNLSVIEVQPLVKRYGDLLAVRDVSLQVEETEIFGILGPNGSGKTTTVECLQGLRPFDGGSASVLKLDPSTQAEQLRRLIGSQIQESALPDRVKVWEALDLFASIIPEGARSYPCRSTPQPSGRDGGRGIGVKLSRPNVIDVERLVNPNTRVEETGWR